MDYPSFEASRALAEVWPDGARAVLGWTGTTWQQSSGLDDLTVDGRRAVLDEYTEAVPVRTFSEMVEKCREEGLEAAIDLVDSDIPSSRAWVFGAPRQYAENPLDAFALALAAALNEKGDA